MSSYLIQNSIFIPEDDLFIKSEHIHDFICHKFKDGLEICVDGGVGPGSYGRRAGDIYKLIYAEPPRYQEYCLSTDDLFEGWITDRLLWGSRGKDGKEPLTHRTIKEYAHRPDGKNHLQAILANCLNISPLHKRVVEYWLEKLKSNTNL